MEDQYLAARINLSSFSAWLTLRVEDLYDLHNRRRPVFLQMPHDLLFALEAVGNVRLERLDCVVLQHGPVGRVDCIHLPGFVIALNHVDARLQRRQVRAEVFEDTRALPQHIVAAEEDPFVREQERKVVRRVTGRVVCMQLDARVERERPLRVGKCLQRGSRVGCAEGGADLLILFVVAELVDPRERVRVEGGEERGQPGRVVLVPVREDPARGRKGETCPT